MCTRWDDYNTYIIQYGIPSIAAACAVCATILHTYQYILGIVCNPFTYIFDILSLLFVSACMYSYIYSYKHNWAIVTVKIIIALAWITGTALCAMFATISMCANTIDKHEGIFSALVLDSEYKRYNTAALVHCTGTNGTFKAYCIFDTHYQLHVGDTIVFSATAYPTRSHEAVNTPYLVRKGISAVFYIKQDSIIMHTQAHPGIRKKIQEYIKHSFYSTYSNDAASLFSALYLGNREYIHPQVQVAFKQAGVLHVLAASGLHVGIIICGIMALCRLLSAPKNISLLLAALCVCTYLFISDQPVSLVRASLMCVVGALCIALNAQRHTINILCITACIILLLYPYELFSAGFQLSFLATAGILLVYNRFHEGLTHFGKAAAPLAITFAAQLFTLPVMVCHFQELSIIAFASNLVIIPLVSVYMIAGILTPLSGIIGAGNVFGYCINYLYTCIISCIKCFASLHGTVYITSFAQLIMYIIVLLLPLVYKRRANAIILAMLIASMVYSNQPKLSHIIQKKSDSSCYVAKIENGSAQCIMALNSYTDYMQLAHLFKRYAVARIAILLPDASFKSCAYAALLGKQYCLEKIYIQKFTPSSIKKLSYMAHIDNIPLEFIQHNNPLLKQPVWRELWDTYISMEHVSGQ
ncbi:MAG: ComEC/Rec2 family competence protein [Spirochaetota bacterium]